MNIKRTFFLITTSILLPILMYVCYKKLFVQTTAKPPFKTQKALKQPIVKTINTEGSLEAIDSLKVGPLITGTVKKIYVKEGQAVKKGDLIMQLIDDQRPEDLQVRERKGVLEQVQAQLEYLEKNLARQRKIYEAKQLSEDEFENILKNYQVVVGQVKEKQALYENSRYFYEAIHVRAPHDGIILWLAVTEGTSVSPTAQITGYILFEIAKNLDTLKASLAIDETRVGDIARGQKVTITVDTYPYKKWNGTITTIGNVPIATGSSTDTKVRYKAEVILSDKQQSLKPGMTVHAKITVAKAKDVLTVPGYVFYINPQALKIIAKQTNKHYKPLDQAEKKRLYKDEANRPLQFLWLYKDDSFVETAVEVGVTNDSFYQVISGIGEQDEILHDINEADAMKEFYAKQFGGGL